MHKNANNQSIFKIIFLNFLFLLLLLYFFETIFTIYKSSRFYFIKLKKNNRDLLHTMKKIQETKDVVVPIFPSYLLRNNMFEIKINNDNHKKIIRNEGWERSGEERRGEEIDSAQRDEDEKIFPLSGISKKFTIFCQESNYLSEYTSDRYGFNNNDNLYDENDIDFLLIGDSFAHGMCVNYGDTFQGNFNKKNYKSISFGYSGNGTLLEYATLKEYANTLKFKAIIWLYHENDIAEMNFEIKKNFLKKYLVDEDYSQNLSKKQKLIDKIQYNNLNKIINEKEKLESNFINLNYININDILTLNNIKNLIRVNFKLYFNSGSNKDSPSYEDYEIFREIILKAFNLSKKKNSKFYFVMLPAYPGTFDTDDIRHINYLKVKEIIKNLDINLIDLSVEMFEKSQDPKNFFPLRIAGHYTEEGYKLAADILISIISKDILKN